MEVKNCPPFFLNNKPNFSYTLIKNEFDELLKKSSHLRMAWHCFQVFFLPYNYVATFCSLIIATVANNCVHAIYFFSSYQKRWDLARFFYKKGHNFSWFWGKIGMVLWMFSRNSEWDSWCVHMTLKNYLLFHKSKGH